MTFDEALGLLEIEAQASAEQARRAYLKKVKVYRPERDPEGFRRVREAYELVASALPVAILEQGSSSFSEEPVVRFQHDGVVSAAEPDTPGAGSEGEIHEVGDPPATPAPAADVAAPDDDATDDDDADSDADADEADDIDDDEDDDPQTLMASQATPHEVDVWLRDAYPRLLHVLERARDGTAPHVPAWTGLTALAALAARGEWDKATTLQAALSNWQVHAAGSAERFRGTLAARFALLSDLVSLGRRLDRQVSAAIGRGVLRDDPNIVALELHQYAQSFPERAIEALHEAKAKAPYLHGVLAQHIHVEVHEVPNFRQSVRAPRWPLWIGVVALLNLFRLCASSGSSDSSPEATTELLARQRALAAVPSTAASVGFGAVESPRPSATPLDEPGAVNFNNVHRAHDALAALSTDSDIADLRQMNEVLYGAFENQSCAAVAPAFHALEQNTRGSDRFVRNEVQRYWAEYLILCPVAPDATSPRESP